MIEVEGPLGTGNGLARKLKNLGLDGDDEVQALLGLVKSRRRARRGEDIIKVGKSSRFLTVLLNGMACRYKMTDNGRRQIFAFHYAGDFCDHHRYAFAERDDAVAALTDCLVGVILHDDIERLSARNQRINLVLWRNTMLEESLIRERLLNVGQRSALERIARLLCEHIFRLEAIGVHDHVIPLTQIDIADAAGLSVVHVNRTIQDLRELGALSKHSHGMRVASRERLVHVARFDGRYLDMRQVMSG